MTGSSWDSEGCDGETVITWGYPFISCEDRARWSMGG